MESLTQFPNLLRLLASRTANLMNGAEVSRASGLPYTTLNRYLAILEGLFLFQPLEAWTGNATKRLTRARKIHIVDSGLAAQVARITEGGLDSDFSPFGALLESFVVGELRKQAGWHGEPLDLTHFRTPAGDEVDIVLERGDGRVLGIEVKVGSSLTGDVTRGLRRLAEACGPRFHRGVVLYGGAESLSLGERFDALPVSALWRWGATPAT